jgi:hypothetical protein
MFCASLEIVRSQGHFFACVPGKCSCRETYHFASLHGNCKCTCVLLCVRPWKMCVQMTGFLPATFVIVRAQVRLFLHAYLDVWHVQGLTNLRASLVIMRPEGRTICECPWKFCVHSDAQFFVRTWKLCVTRHAVFACVTRNCSCTEKPLFACVHGNCACTGTQQFVCVCKFCVDREARFFMVPENCVCRGMPFFRTSFLIVSL